ncbi:hypothetical protein CRG98_041839, partial [Punica granatum]
MSPVRKNGWNRWLGVTSSGWHGFLDSSRKCWTWSCGPCPSSIVYAPHAYVFAFVEPIVNSDPSLCRAFSCRCCAHPNFISSGHATRLGSIYLPGDARWTHVRRSRHSLFTTRRSRAVESPGSRVCAPEFHLVGTRMREAYATRLGSVHLPGDARRTR